MKVAVFDLDGTITRRDTLWPYLRGWVRLTRRRAFWRRALAAAARFPLDRDRGVLKFELIRAAMGGATRAEVTAWTTEFVAGLGPAELCPGALEAIARHRAAGDRLVLLSASVDLYVPDIGRRLAFDETICTGVAWRDGRLDGALVTENRRGAEKRRCVEALRDPPSRRAVRRIRQCAVGFRPSCGRRRARPGECRCGTAARSRETGLPRRGVA